MPQGCALKKKKKKRKRKRRKKSKIKEEERREERKERKERKEARLHEEDATSTSQPLQLARYPSLYLSRNNKGLAYV